MVANGRQTVAQLRDVLVQGFKVSLHNTLSSVHIYFCCLGIAGYADRERAREREGEKRRLHVCPVGHSVAIEAVNTQYFKKKTSFETMLLFQSPLSLNK